MCVVEVLVEWGMTLGGWALPMPSIASLLLSLTSLLFAFSLSVGAHDHLSTCTDAMITGRAVALAFLLQKGLPSLATALHQFGARVRGALVTA